MTNPLDNISFIRLVSVGAAAKPLPTLRQRKGSERSRSCNPRSPESNHLVKTRADVPGAEAFEEMFVASRQQFVAMAYSILRHREDAEDAVHNALISGYLHLRNFQGRSALKTWFTRVVLNAALMIRRKQKSVRLVATPEWASEEGSKWIDEIPSPEPDPEMHWAKTEAQSLIEEVTAHLKPRLREAFSMYYEKELSLSQARVMAGVSMTTFKARLFRARRQVISEAKRALVLGPQKQADEYSLSAVS